MSEPKKPKNGIELDVIELPKITPQFSNESENIVAEETAPEVSLKGYETPFESEAVDKTKTISKPKSKTGIILTSFILITACVVIFFIWHSHTQNMNRQNAFILPLDRLCLKLENSSLRLHASIKEIEDLSVNINSKSKVKLIVETIDTAKIYLSEFISNIGKFEYFINNDQTASIGENQTYIVETNDFFNHEDHKHYLRILTEYLDVYKRYLTYYYNNFDEIKDKQQAKVKSLEVLYIKYKRISNIYQNVDAVNRKNIRQLIEKHPEAARFFPNDQKGSIFKWTN